MTQTRTTLLLLLHCGETFASITGEAALRLAFLVVFQVGGVAEKSRVASDNGWLVMRPRCADLEAETSRWIKAGIAGRGWETVDGEHKVDLGWLRVAVDAASQKGMPGAGCGAEGERMRGRGGQEEEVMEQFPNSVQKVLGGCTVAA